jgi:hypothetical protein
VRSVRRGTLVLGVAVLAYGVLLLFAGELRLAVSAALVGGGAILLVTWARGFPAREWIATALLFTGIGLVGSPFFALVLLAAAVGLQWWLRRRLRERLSAALEPAGDAVMPGAEEAVAAFETAGFRRCGAFGSQGAEPRVVSVLAGEGGDRFAVVTDRTYEVVSRFRDRRLLTIDRGVGPAPPHTLRQVVGRAGPAELAAAHQAALAILGERGLEPDRLANDDAILEAALDYERSAIASVTGLGLGEELRLALRRKTSDPPLRDDERSRRRIDDWLAADTPTSTEV